MSLLPAKWKRIWNRLKQAEPGKRFQRHHEAHQQSLRSKWSRWLSVAAGLLIVAVGLVALPAPGPGFLVIALGGALLAQESRRVAEWLDWLELRLRRIWKWARAWWVEAALPAKALVVVFALAIAGGAAYLMYLRMAS